MKVPVAIHEVERISFVVIDPRDTRAFGYVYNSSDDKHQFWAIKTEQMASVSVIALKELFEIAFERYQNSENANVVESTITSASNSASSVSVVF